MNALAPVVIEPTNPGTELAAYQPFRTQLAELKANTATLVFDYESKKGNADARSHVYKLRQTKSAVDKARLDEKRAYIEVGKKIDAEAYEIIDEIEAMIAIHQKPLDEIAQREKDRVAGIKARIDDIRGAALLGFDATSETVGKALADIIAIAIDTSFAEFLGEAAMAKDATVRALDTHLAAIQEREAEKAENERMRREAVEREQRERDEQIQRDAAAAAEREKDAAAKAELEAVERKAKDEREAAEKRELELRLEAEEAKRLKAEAERRANEAVQAERERVRKKVEEEAAEEARRKAEEDALEAKRQADEKHQFLIHTAIADALTGLIGEEEAELVTQAIRNGVVPHVKIIY